MTSFQGYTSSGQSGNRWQPLPIIASRDPVDNFDLADPSGGPYQIDQEWFNTSNSAFWKYAGQGIWVKLASSADNLLQTLSDDVNTLIYPDTSHNIQLVGHVVEQGATKFSTVVTGTNIANINPMSASRWIVDPLGFNGTHTTIASAMASATSGDTIMLLPGTYTENWTMKAGVNVTGYTPNGSSTAGITLSGKITMTAAGISGISNCFLTTNNDYIVEITGSNEINLVFINCFFAAGSGSAFHSTNSNAASQLIFKQCKGNLTQTGITWFVSTGAETLNFEYSTFVNGANSTTVSTKSGGSINLTYSMFQSPISATATGGTWRSSYLECQNLNTTALTTATAGSFAITGGKITSGTATAVSIGASTTVQLYNCDIASTNATPISGAGTLVVTANGNSVKGTNPYSVTITTRRPFGEYGTCTPVFAFSGGSTGITYGTQSGTYTIIGTTVFYQFVVILTSKGSSTGTAQITCTTLPPPSSTFVSCMTTADMTFSAGYVEGIVLNSGGFKMLFQNCATTGTTTNLTDTSFTDTTSITVTGHYFI